MTSRRQTLCDGAKGLEANGVPNAMLDAQWILAHVVGMPRLNLLMALEAPVSAAEGVRYEALILRRAAGEPLQYVLGETDFMGHTFRVDKRTLIPRSDTEALCEAAMARLQPGMGLIDIGTGSGALAISLALFCPLAQVTGLDISPDALAVARANGEALGAKVEWVEGDLFPLPPEKPYDIIVSNPPYIPTETLGVLQREVQREPRLALDGGEDGLVFYRRIAAALPERLKAGGSLLLETGDGQGTAVAEYLQGLFNRVQIIRDLGGLERVVIGDGYAR